MTDSALLEQLERARKLGFIGRAPVDEQLAHARSVIGQLPKTVDSSDRTLLDLGSGGGLPGLAAIDDPSWSRVVLLDRSERRCAFLRSVVAQLGAGAHVEVVAGSAETIARREEYREAFDAVSARSFGPPAATVECGSGFLRVGGHLVVSDPPSGREWPKEALGQLMLEVVAASDASPAWSLLTKKAPLGTEFPRRAGIPVRQPLF